MKKKNSFKFINIFFKTSFSFKPLDAIETKLFPYLDTNKNGYHDFVYDYLNPGYDFPHPNDVPEPETGRLTNIHDLSSLSIGLSKTFLEGKLTSYSLYIFILLIFFIGYLLDFDTGARSKKMARRFGTLKVWVKALSSKKLERISWDNLVI